MKKEAIKYTGLAALGFFMLGCENPQPVKQCLLTDVIPASYIDSLTHEKSRTTFDFAICHYIKVPWDSLLIVKPYTDEDAVKATSIKNYTGIQQVVQHQSMNDGTCTVLFVHRGTYTAYGVFSRTPVDFSTISSGRGETLTWITKNDCSNLYIKKDTINKMTFFSLQSKGKN